VTRLTAALVFTGQLTAIDHPGRRRHRRDPPIFKAPSHGAGLALSRRPRAASSAAPLTIVTVTDREGGHDV